MRIYPFIFGLYFSLMLFGCDQSMEQNEDMSVERTIGFATSTPETRGELGFLSNNFGSMGVFAFYTQGDWKENEAPFPNVMFNQLVEKMRAGWNYSPTKYWPENVNDRLSFFAYAPYNAEGLTTSPANQNGYPQLTYTVPAMEKHQQDLLVADPQMNLMKQRGQVPFMMRHALTKVNIYVQCSGTFKASSLSIKAPKTGTLTYNKKGFDWQTTDEMQDNVATLSSQIEGQTGRILLATFYLLPGENVNASLSAKYTYTSGMNQPEKTIELDKDLPVANWKAGTSVAYVLDLTNNGTGQIKIETGMDWTGVEKNIQLFSSKDVKLGDFYYNDGTIGDGGLRKIDDNGNYIFDRVEITRPRDCIGVVFRAGRDASDKGVYSNLNNQTVKGYVVALYFCEKGNISKKGNPSQTGASTDLFDFQGYYNTQKIDKNSSLVKNIERFSLIAPKQSSGWFIPSYGQMQSMWDMKDFLNVALTNGGGVEINSKGQLMDDPKIWTSTEQNSTMQYAFDLGTGVNAKGYSKEEVHRTRLILVF